MQQVKVILFIFLIAKSTFGMGLMSTMKAISSSSCHFEASFAISELVDSNTDLLDDYSQKGSGDKGCCEDGICHCVCCGHIFTTKTISKTLTTYAKLPVKHDHFYNVNYLYNGVNHIWQPPQNI